VRICFIADYRSPIARSWVDLVSSRGHQVHVLSTYPCPPPTTEHITVEHVAAAFSGLSSAQHRLAGLRTTPTTQPLATRAPRLDSVLRGRAGLRAEGWAATTLLPRQAADAQEKVAAFGPDLVHAMRIPFEGILASVAVRDVPLVVSIWGNDLTLHAARDPVIAWMTRRVLRRAAGLHVDCERDRVLALESGYPADRPALKRPGVGAIDRRLFHPGPVARGLRAELGIGNGPVIVNPRGIREYVCNASFFRSLPHVQRRFPDAVSVCVGMKGHRPTEHLIHKLGIEDAVLLLPTIERELMADLFRIADVSVSPTTHDGTPNTLLEAMASGCFPVVGDVDSVRETITDGVNGIVCDPTDGCSIAASIIRALGDVDLRRRAAARNDDLAAGFCDLDAAASDIERLYSRVVA
jgi:glycosyltransferase involved in cell wall biosynthesis